MTPLERLIREIIAAEGPVGVDRFMDLALGHPEHGYYRTRDPLGERGDFVTAPEVSQMFGELIGLWCAATWQAQGAPTPALLVELGPGRGTQMADALRAIRKTLPAFREAVSVHLVETGPVLRKKQSAALSAEEPVWHGDLASVPDGPAFVIANEFLDALPVQQFVWRGGKAHERRVGLIGDRLAFVEAGSPADLGTDFPPAADGTVQERNPAAETVAAQLGARIAAFGGAALLIDYGYTKTQPGETLQSVRGHKTHDVLADPGEADLTAHVDFAAVARAAARAGAAVHGPVPQGLFLRRLGIDARRDALMEQSSPALIQDAMLAHERLTGAEGMGELFKAMALTGPDAPPPAGF